MENYANKIAITTGDPNGIGAEITIKALNLLNLPAKAKRKNMGPGFN